MPSLPSSEIKAIVKLLQSKDESTSKLLEEQLRTFDSSLLKDIESEISQSDRTLREQFFEIILRIKREKLKEEFPKWGTSKLSNLEEGVFLLASFNNPFINVYSYSSLFDSWAKELAKNLEKLKLPQDSTSIINEVNHYLFMELGFRGNKKDYYNPNNSFLDKVIDTKLGNPILLSVIYLAITTRLGLPFSGVNMPAHFLVQYTDSFDPIFIDPFNEGEIITKEMCKERVKSLKLAWSESFLETPTNNQMIIRIMQNLINIYDESGETELKEYLESYVRALKRY